MKAAGGVLTAKQAPRRPGTAPAPGLRRPRCPTIVSQTNFEREERQCHSPVGCTNFHSTLAPGRGQRHHGRRASLRAAIHRPRLEFLEDRVTPSFSPATSFPVGPNPQAVVTADFNNDGHLDLATANAGGNTVSVLLGDGLGGFGAANHFAAGTGPRSMAVGDFNNDGHLDLVTVGDQVAGASIMLGNGDGTFRAPTNHSVWGGPQAVAVGDFNADGSMDIVVSEYDGQDGFGKVQVLLGNGQGGFTAANAYTLDFFLASGLAVSDLNGDGKLDVAVVVPREWASRRLRGPGQRRRHLRPGVLRRTASSSPVRIRGRWRSAISPAMASPTWLLPARRWTCFAATGTAGSTTRSAIPPTAACTRAWWWPTSTATASWTR